METGCYTALVTPFSNDEVDFDGLEKLVDFQVEGGITGILAVGTTGESPSFDWKEHNAIVGAVSKRVKGKCLCISGAGSNNTKETMSAAQHASDVGVNALLLVDPYYNGPSSLEIRREYLEPVAKKFPDMTIIPYIIPGRTGTQMFPEDLAIAGGRYSNINVVKEATGDLDNMRKTRKCCGPDFMILSGDDGMTLDMMTDPEIMASGVISVASNVVPAAVTEMVSLLAAGKVDDAKKIIADIEPLFDLVTVKTMEKTSFGDVECRARNPLGIKTLMQILGMPSGACRKPLGKMTRKGINKVLEAARTVQAANPEILKPVGDFFGVEIDQRLNDPVFIDGLYYDSY